MFRLPKEFRKHLISDHHSKERILSDAGDGYTVVLELEGKNIGTGTLLGNEILVVFVHPSYQRKGFGKSIMHVLVERVLINGVNSLALELLSLSKKFYDSLNYTTLKEVYFSAGTDQNYIL
ncbi:MAG: GNAT family N-acetyltransferase [Thermoproteota archaeon]